MRHRRSVDMGQESSKNVPTLDLIGDVGSAQRAAKKRSNTYGPYDAACWFLNPICSLILSLHYRFFGWREVSLDRESTELGRSRNKLFHTGEGDNTKARPRKETVDYAPDNVYSRTAAAGGLLSVEPALP